MVIHHANSRLVEETKGLTATLVESSSYRKCKDVIEVTGSSSLETLKISFHRTIRVSDDQSESNLPLSMGTFPLYSVVNYNDKLPAAMAAKGGLFLPIYQREAMWIRFQSSQKFVIKILVGGVNAVSGEPEVEKVATMLRRQNLIASKKSVQDYVVTPDQLWLDGIASNDGCVRQFVAMPLGSGYSVEAQITGQETTGGLQFVTIPSAPLPPPTVLPYAQTELPVAKYPALSLRIMTLTGKSILINCPSKLTTTVESLKHVVKDAEGIPPDQQRYVYAHKQLEDRLTLHQCNIPDQATIHLVLRLRGGGYASPDPDAEMGIASGGLIKQCILSDKHSASIWERERSISFNVQLLNSGMFRRVTGVDPPASPITAQTYAMLGLPYFDIYDEQSTIKGDFDKIKSVSAIDEAKDREVNGNRCRAGRLESPRSENPVILLNPNGSNMPFQSVSEMTAELERMNHVQF